MNRYPLCFLCLLLLAAQCFVACRSDRNGGAVDRLNYVSYSWHYRNLDTTYSYASRALALAVSYPDGRAEALNNLAFVSIARMNYADADSLLHEAVRTTDNQLEQLVGNVQLMRLCQRRSDNKNFYLYCQRATECIKRLREDESYLSPRQQHRFAYACSEYSIVYSTYLYYVGQRLKSSEVLSEIDPGGAIVKDTAQLLAYYYNVGAGGILNARSHGELMQSEFDYLMRCYLLSRQYRYDFWEANSLQAISEHLQESSNRHRLVADNMQEFDFLNVDQMPDSLLAGNLAQRALSLFEEYGDVYQEAGAWRTLSESYRAIGDYQSALLCLENALSKDTAVNSAPDLVASIREQMSILYSAMGDKAKSDYCRNIYIDLQENSRQDRFLEARAEQLDNSLRQLDMIILAVILAIFAVVAVLLYFGYWRHKHSSIPSLDSMQKPLDRWRSLCRALHERTEEEIEELEDDTLVMGNRLERLRERHIEQRAKVWLASTVTPLISRMLREIKFIETLPVNSDRHEHLEYISQLADSVDESNRKLTHWIQLRQGDFNLRIESFPLDVLFDTIRQNVAGFKLHGIMLSVSETDAVVKADRTLTLFMINTMVENARHHTPAGGTVVVSSAVTGDYVEVSIADNGNGMTDEQRQNIFKHRLIVDSSDPDTECGHGFGLVNCKGIIEKYRKLSAIFNVCQIGVESRMGEGSRFFFRLPKGIVRLVIVFATILGSASPAVALSAGKSADNFRAVHSRLAGAFADSAYYSNINGTYTRTVAFADSCLRHLNIACASAWHGRKDGDDVLRLTGDYPAKAAELKWLRDSLDIDYNIILDIRNETAVAALALHDWSLYSYNNAVYTQLFREHSADNTLASYVSSMQKANTNRNIAVIMLVALLLGILPAYYLLYYRRRMYIHYCIDRVRTVNDVLSDSGLNSVQKLCAIDRIWESATASKGKGMGMAHWCPDQLRQLVERIHADLVADIQLARRLADRKDCARDKLQRVTMDCDRLYISCNVLDNSLSSLKHETMYYPSRLKQLVLSSEGSCDIETLDELTTYYKVLYNTLISQAVQALDSAGVLATPDVLAAYMFAMLRRKNGGKKLTVSKEQVACDGYVVVDVKLECISSVSPEDLFTPRTADVDFLVCCQVLRDMGECTGARGCGISAHANCGMLVVSLKLPLDVWRQFKCEKGDDMLTGVPPLPLVGENTIKR